MNTHLMRAENITGKIESLCRAIDEMYMEEAPDEHQYLIELMSEQISALKQELELLSTDCIVVNAIYAAKDVRKQNAKTE